MPMTMCESCGYTSVRRPGTDCPICDDRKLLDLTPQQVFQVVNPPYTPEQRTKLVSDNLNCLQERTEFSADEWKEDLKKVTTLEDDALHSHWHNEVGAYLLNRDDIPGEDNFAVQALLGAGETELSPGDAIVTFQLFKRLNSSYERDYGFLGESTYSHISDRPESITVQFAPDNSISQIKSEVGLTPREIQMLLQEIEQDPLWLQSPADRQTEAYTETTISREEVTQPDTDV